jgi:hypothetical protein
MAASETSGVRGGIKRGRRHAMHGFTHEAGPFRPGVAYNAVGSGDQKLFRSKCLCYSWPSAGVSQGGR